MHSRFIIISRGCSWIWQYMYCQELTDFVIFDIIFGLSYKMMIADSHYALRYITYQNDDCKLD